MTLYLDTPTPADLLQVIEWRKTCPQALRTPRDLTPPEQERFYAEYVANPKSPHRYYAVVEWHNPITETGIDAPPYREFVALVSLENLSWENGHAELGLIVDPARQHQGIGRQAVALVLEVAFNRLRLSTCWLECYLTGPVAFWTAVLATYGGTSTVWPRRTWWQGTLHDAVLGTITAEGWRKAKEKGANP